jgi:predicted phosphohydrolase
MMAGKMTREGRRLRRRNSLTPRRKEVKPTSARNVTRLRYPPLTKASSPSPSTKHLSSQKVDYTCLMEKESKKKVYTKSSPKYTSSSDESNDESSDEKDITFF